MASQAAAVVENLPLMNLQAEVVARDPADPFDSAAMMEEGHAPGAASVVHDNNHNDHCQNQDQNHLLNIVLVLGLGVYKAAASYLSQEIAPTTLDWILGVCGL
ncbi:hypothetical protein K438DRAFT_1967016 [Mycena galopus ATCC 62051]|nr:hypothetical protein K438DRAFT_1967016 [Mycena galopus ATCC 62051]